MANIRMVHLLSGFPILLEIGLPSVTTPIPAPETEGGDDRHDQPAERRQRAAEPRLEQPGQHATHSPRRSQPCHWQGMPVLRTEGASVGYSSSRSQSQDGPGRPDPFTGK